LYLPLQFLSGYKYLCHCVKKRKQTRADKVAAAAALALALYKFCPNVTWVNMNKLRQFISVKKLLCLKKHATFFFFKEKRKFSKFLDEMYSSLYY
jgi:hypothetical protein